MAQLARPPRTTDTGSVVEVRRSARRRRTVSAYRDGDRIVVLVPARLSKADEQRLVSDLVERITRREADHARSGARRGDAALMARASELSQRFLDGRPRPTSVRWVRNMTTRWGSCTMVDGTIRLSHRLQPMPTWVIDYVLVHELAHLLEPGHGPAFWRWVNRYPRTERARGYLEGVAAAAQLPGLSDCDSSEESDGEPSAGVGPPAGGWPSDSEPAGVLASASPGRPSASETAGPFPVGWSGFTASTGELPVLAEPPGS